MITVPFFFDKSHRDGVTLIELVIVLAIIAVLSGIAAMGAGFTSTERVRDTTNDLLADLQQLRQYAMVKGPDAAAQDLRGYGIRFETNKKYMLFRFNDTNQNFEYNGTVEEAPLSAGEASVKQRNIPETLELKVKSGASLADPVNDVLIFDHRGMPRAGGFGFSQISIVIQNPGLPDVTKQCVTISFNRIREGEWDGNRCKEQ